MKTTYSGAEWVHKTSTAKRGWFTRDTQDQLCFHMAFQLYLQYDEEDQTPETFDKLIDEAQSLVDTFYSARYNPETRRS